MNRLIGMGFIWCVFLLLAACGGGGGGGGGGGTGLPAAPSGLTATAASPSRIDLAWTDNSTNETGFQIERRTGSGSYQLVTTTGANVTSYSDTGLSASTQYTYRVRAINSTGQSAYTAEVPATTTALQLARPVTGSVTDPVSEGPVPNATVSAFIQIGSIVAKRVAAETPVATTTTDANGNFTFTNLQDGTTYYFVINRDGYEPFTYYNVQPTADNPLTLERARVIPSTIAQQTADISGKVKNATNNQGLPNMTVRLRSGVGNTSGTVLQTTTTSTDGSYRFTGMRAGSYTAEVSGSVGSQPIVTTYFTLVSVPGTDLNANQDLPVTVEVSGSQYRIVLSWGNNPSDLDSHLTGPTAGSGRFHVAFYADDYPSGTAVYSNGYYTAGPGTEAYLDVDNTSHGYGDNGPETTTIVVPRNGEYRFYVHHYGGTGATISTSGAQVKLYKGSTLLATFNPPSGAVGSGDVWAVFSMTVSGNSQTVTPLDRIYPNAGTSNLDGLTGGTSACGSGPFTNRLTIGSGFDGTTITGVGSSFSLSSLANSGDLYARIESSTPFETEGRFARLYINGGAYGQKDFCSSCNTQPVLNCPNVMIGKFRITDTGSFSLSAYSVPFQGGSETPVGTESITIGQ